MIIEHLPKNHNHTVEKFNRHSSGKPATFEEPSPFFMYVRGLILCVLAISALMVFLMSPAEAFKQPKPVTTSKVQSAAQRACPIDHVAVWIDPTTIQCHKDITY